MGRRYSRNWHDHVIPVPWSGCWLWEGEDVKGYGTHRLDNQRRLVHRLAWEEVNGLIPDGLFVCHHCDVKLCCNPAHLFLGTSRDNILDLYRKGLGYQRRITHCPKGHEYTPENTAIQADGKRRCRACYRDKHSAHYWANKEVYAARAASRYLMEKEAIDQRNRAWREGRADIKDLQREYARRYREKKREAQECPG